MIVLVETNFVLELVFSRDKSVYCRDFMHMAETKQIDLLLPAYCMASVLSSLSQRSEPACFITANSKDFSTPGVAEALEPFDCKLMFDFENGLNFVRNMLENKTP